MAELASLPMQRSQLPTALARRTVLGLMWMTKDLNGFNNNKFTFRLKDMARPTLYEQAMIS